MSDFTHIVRFYPAFDDPVNGCEHKRKGDHGRSSVQLVMASLGTGAVASWGISTNWHLPETYEKGRTIYGTPIDWGDRIHLGMGSGVIDLHSAQPLFESHDWTSDQCRYIDGLCYFDAAYVASDELEDALLRGGDEAVWPLLDEWVADIIERQGALA